MSSVNHSEHSNSVHALLQKKKSRAHHKRKTEAFIPVLLFILASISILVTVGIVFTLLKETISFFQEVSLVEFFTGTVLKPLSQNPSFGILPLITGTVLSAGIAMLVSVPIGLLIAIYLSEYASKKIRIWLKPIMEILAGIPTIVYGFFCFYLCNTDSKTSNP